MQLLRKFIGKSVLDVLEHMKCQKGLIVLTDKHPLTAVETFAECQELVKR